MLVFVFALQNLITKMLQASKSFCDPTPLILTFVLSERVALDQDFVTTFEPDVTDVLIIIATICCSSLSDTQTI